MMAAPGLVRLDPESSEPSDSSPRRCSFAELDHSDSALNRVAAQTTQADPFSCRTEWQFSFHEVFGSRRTLHLRTAGDSAIALALRGDTGTGPLLEPIESDWRFGCPLLGTQAVELLDSLLEEKPIRRPRPSVLLTGLLPGGPLLRSVASAFRERYEITRLAPRTLCSASLEGGLDGFLSRRSPRLRRRLRQAACHAAESGVSFERCVPRGASETGVVYARMLAVELASWKGIGRCGMAQPGSREFYQRMLRRLSLSGSGRVMFARCEGQDIGFIFGGLAGAFYRGQQFSYADGWSASSIGNLLQLEQIRWLCEEGVARYDMGPLMDYKRHWTELEIPIEARLLRRRSPGRP